MSVHKYEILWFLPRTSAGRLVSEISINGFTETKTAITVCSGAMLACLLSFGD